jgi:hypothetical protein
MSDGLLKRIDADMSTIPPVEPSGESDRDRVMKLFSHVLLRLWTRLALESGQKLVMIPSQFVLGTYEGQMKWSINDSADFRHVSQIELGMTFKKKHALIAETYVLRGEERARLFFSLEDQKVKNKPVFVNYLVYEASLKEFEVNAVVSSLKLAAVSWLETVTTSDEASLWNYCKDKLECVGV